MRALLRAMSGEVRAEKSARICTELSGPLEPGTLILTFASLPTEPDLGQLWGCGLRLAFPRVAGEKLELWRVAAPEDLAPGAFGIREPIPERCERVEMAEIGVALVPGLAFHAESGARLGQGGGFYDRLLARRELPTIGVCFREQLLAEIPVEAHDQRVGRVVTD